ncbi:hypothetical protein FRC12_013120, partial [Ceratobasidium sp. 428]
ASLGLAVGLVVFVTILVYVGFFILIFVLVFVLILFLVFVFVFYFFFDLFLLMSWLSLPPLDLILWLAGESGGLKQGHLPPCDSAATPLPPPQRNKAGATGGVVKGA